MDKYILQTIYFLKKIFLENKKNEFKNDSKIVSEFCRKLELELAQRIGTQEGTIITSVYATSLGKNYAKKEGEEKSNNKISFVKLVLDWLNDTSNWDKSKLYSELKKKEQYKDFFSNPEKFNIDELIQKTYIINSIKILKTKNIMLYGSPGVGKTNNYKRLITMIENESDEKTIFDTISKNETTNDFDNAIFETIKNEKRIEFVTFHQSYSYEDFIEGFRPQENGIIDREDGIFKTLCEEADKDPSKNFYIVIDEINRGNISKIFGELITLIEEDKRGKEEYRVKLPYSKKTFLVPSNLYIIATMNSTDKSIATIDIALRRRFTFLKMKPNLDLVENQEAKKLMKNLNTHISKTINENYQLGHSYFMKIENENDLEFVKEYKIKPLLEEYFYGDEKNFDEAIAILNKKEDNQ